ncbi:nuclear transport factor 2 family protein [Sediminibacillus albus]|uniref:SnoaL-like domain-containing protein n=1 Tax=Sediminibacillus albus TaxID=407036 RepID=A0A1G9C4E5_9BACI|nr:nuclear transport factor 2 family protein [Sediminibacillus albus]SDK46538.1 SnoaL-like domain-containing protein [Sediminibacillus albus]
MENNKYSNLVRSYFKAYETNQQGILEEILSRDFTFSSPVDDKINRGTYFERCWPSCKDIHEYHISNFFAEGNEAFIRYECELNSGATFRNMEHFRFDGNQIKEIIVYFGFDLRKDTFAEMRAKRFNDAFASGNVDYIIGNTAEDVKWHFVGESKLRGREAVIKMIEPMRGVIPKDYKTNNILIHGNKAVIEGTMTMTKENGEDQPYAYCDIYTFAQSNKETIKDLTAYLIELPNEKEQNNE